jgi:hypothetical protein
MAVLSNRARAKLWVLQVATNRVAEERRVAVRMLLASRRAATHSAQREYWLEFAVIHEEYRAAMRALAEFCEKHVR